MEAVCGFYFSDDRTQVVLIRKNRPAWQAGMINGVGGKTESGETPLDAMIREFHEETGVLVKDWDHYCTHTDRGHSFKIWFFRAFAQAGHLSECRSMTDEQVLSFSVDSLYKLPVIPNLRWLIPMALDSDLTEAQTLWGDA